ncbi:MAG: hypothetical protein K2N34_00910 [Lachnospiraceae bacterium]|nr:hypothetical protein [Lachnospiraceae bacterium]
MAVFDGYVVQGYFDLDSIFSGKVVAMPVEEYRHIILPPADGVGDK